jgi:hypothetical protein
MGQDRNRFGLSRYIPQEVSILFENLRNAAAIPLISFPPLTLFLQDLPVLRRKKMAIISLLNLGWGAS